MALPRPSKFPEYARNDVVDPTSGVNNVVEPGESKKDLGHGPLGEFPPRQYMNWIHRLTTEWLKWLDEQVTDVLPVSSGTYQAKVETVDFDAQYIFEIKWQKQGDVVSIAFPAFLKPSNGTSGRIRIKPHGDSGNFPAAILPISKKEQFFRCFKDSGAEIRVPGTIEIQSGATADWDLAVCDTSAELKDDNFTAVNSKGWEAQTITYSLTNPVLVP